MITVTAFLRTIIRTLAFLLFFLQSFIGLSQNCNNWLYIPDQPSYMRIGDLDIAGNRVTVEAVINRTSPWNGVDLFQGDVVSKHENDADCNYLLRPSSAEITTTNGYYKTPTICPIELNKTYHIAMVYDGRTLKFYRNGFLMSETPASGDLIQNDWETQIGLYFGQIYEESFIGYINEVRIWNIARTQNEISTYMFRSLPNPQGASGLLAYYTFDDLKNKQGNIAWNGRLHGNATINRSNPNCTFVADSCDLTQMCPTKSKPDFSFLQDVCSSNTVRYISSDNSYTAYQWEFGNGQASTNHDATVTYSKLGHYSVKLKVQSSSGCWDSIIKRIPIVEVYDNTLLLTRDTTICTGDSVRINSSTDKIFCWKSVTGLQTSASGRVIVKPKQTTTYKYISQKLGVNLVQNGNFSSGASNFSSDFQYSTFGLGAGVYHVGADIVAWYPNMLPCGDYTDAHGAMMMVNADGVANANVWKQTINVKPNTTYSFAAWLQTITIINPAQLRFAINDVVIGDVLNTGITSCEWNEFNTIWNSGDQATATISIVNMNRGVSGCVFALDDIFFGEVVNRTDSVRVTVTSKPIINLGNDTTICRGSTIQFNVQGSVSDKVVWNPATYLSNASIKNPTATINESTTYVATVTAVNGCSAQDSIRVSIHPKPVFSATSSQSSICLGDSLILKASGADAYRWSPTSSVLMPDLPETIAAPRSSTVYKIHFKAAECAVEDSAFVSVIVNSIPSLSIKKSNDIDCSNNTSRLVATGGVRYEWNHESSLSEANVPNPIVRPVITTTYVVNAYSSEGCVNKDSIKVNVTTSATNMAYVPSAFTPNGDGLNDCFRVKNWNGVEGFSLVVFNRWGEKIFMTSNSSDCWDGRYKGILQPGGNYVYMLKAKTLCGDFSKSGSFILIR